jgi:glycosyltransferase involved in cell wall biosynthesis
MSNTRKSIALITDARFWRQGAGSWARTRETVKFLVSHSDLKIIFLGRFTKHDVQAIKHFGGSFTFYGLGWDASKEQESWKSKLRQLLRTELTADVYIVARTENSFLLDVIPPSAKKVVDTIDLVSVRTAKLKQLNIREQCPLSEEEERRILDRYDGVICIQQNEYRQVADWIGEEKTIYMPHPLEVDPLPIREKATNIGIVASRWHANFTGLQRFLHEVWPQLDGRGLKLHLYGSIVKEFQHIQQSDVLLQGFQEDLRDCYVNLDIVINPVYYGAGLKIKSVEALSYGLPLVTTEEGASGLEDLAGEGLHRAGLRCVRFAGASRSRNRPSTPGGRLAGRETRCLTNPKLFLGRS